MSYVCYKGKPTIGHEFHHDVSISRVWLDETQTAGSGPNTERWLNQRVHGAARKISGVSTNAATGAMQLMNNIQYSILYIVTPNQINWLMAWN